MRRSSEPPSIDFRMLRLNGQQRGAGTGLVRDASWVRGTTAGEEW
jgi:hypothetical protein